MSITTINVGSAPNDGTGDPLRVAFQTTNTNFLNITADGGDEITVLNPTTATDTTLNDALQDVFDAGGGGGAVTSVNGDTGAVVVDLQSVLTESGTATDLAITLQSAGDSISLTIDNNSIYFENTADNDSLEILPTLISIADNTTSESLFIQKTGVRRNKGAFNSQLLFTDPTANRSITFKDESGTVALLSDITGGVSDGDKGDITVSDSGTVWTIDNGVVNNAKVASGIDAVKLADGSVTNTELQYINSLSSNAQTQLDAKAVKSTSAYSMKVNNTNATADETEVPYRSDGQQAYTDTVTFTAGTAPSGAENKTFNWKRDNNWVKFIFTGDWATTGSTITQAIIPIPSGVPSPVVPTGFTGASVVLYTGTGQMSLALTTGTVSPSDMMSYIRRNASDNGFEFVIAGQSGTYRAFKMTIEYPTS